MKSPSPSANWNGGEQEEGGQVLTWGGRRCREGAERFICMENELIYIHQEERTESSLWGAREC